MDFSTKEQFNYTIPFVNKVMLMFFYVVCLIGLINIGSGSSSFFGYLFAVVIVHGILLYLGMIRKLSKRTVNVMNLMFVLPALVGLVARALL
ncbi:MAG: hypothetical protein ACOCXT_00890 [Candidatus Dojkabacteria bacterium]